MQTKLWLWRLQYNVGTWEGGGLGLCGSGKESALLDVTSPWLGILSAIGFSSKVGSCHSA